MMNKKDIRSGAEYLMLNTMETDDKAEVSLPSVDNPKLDKQTLTSLPLRSSSRTLLRIFPTGVDCRTWAGRRIKAYAYHLATQIPNSDDPVIRARIINAAALLVLGEKLAHRIAGDKPVNPRDVTSVTYAVDATLARLFGKQKPGGRPRKVPDVGR